MVRPLKFKKLADTAIFYSLGFWLGLLAYQIGTFLGYVL